MAARKLFRAMLALVGLLVLVNLIVLLSPWQVFMRSYIHRYVTDHELAYAVPYDQALKMAGDKVGEERICVYWGGVATTGLDFVRVEDDCLPFKEKPDGAKLLDWG